MSLEPCASDVPARSLDLNSAAVSHPEETESSGESGKFLDVGPRDELSGGLREKDKHAEEAKGNDAIRDDFQLVDESVVFSEESLKKGEEVPILTAPVADCNNDLNEIKAAMPEVKEGDMRSSKHPSGDNSLVREDNVANDIDLCLLKEYGSSGEAGETPKSNPVQETQVLRNSPDDKQFQTNEHQECISGFSFCDMVWGKVRSHPWWPGQIFHPSFSSDMALKHKKDDCFLVAYFGDNSFAWNDASQLRPFESCFSQMEKQSNMKAFVDAVDESLREVARRTEIGLTCACISDDVIADLKDQVFENAGIKEGTCFPTMDQCVAASSFKPSRLLHYIQDLAQFPCGKCEKLELVKVKAELKAIYRSKGYPELPEFCSSGGFFDNEKEVLYTEKEEAGKDDTEYKEEKLLLNGTPSKEKQRGRGRPPGKKKQIEEEGRKQKSLPELMEQTVDCASFIDKKIDRMRPIKKKQIGDDHRKEKSLPELMRQTAEYASLNGKKVKGGRVAASRPLSQKRVSSVSSSFEYGRSKKKRLNALGDLRNVSASSSRTNAVKIGERISQVANKMRFSHNYKKLHKGNRKVNGRTTFVRGPSKTPIRDTALVQDCPAPGVMLSQLYLAAQGSTRAYRLKSAVVGFFASWRDSQVSEPLKDRKVVHLMGSRSGPKGIDLVPEETKSGYIQDTYWSDVIFEESPKQERPSNARKRKRKAKIGKSKKKKVAGKSLLSGSLEPTLDISEPISDYSTFVNDEQQQEGNLVSLSDNRIVEECNPAALILNFSDVNALPSESNLITIFSQYGPLKEADTEVSRKCRRASVVFKRGADAEVAFSSAGKFSAFGPALVSYRLRYSTSPSPDITPMKDPSAMDGDTSLLPDSVVVPTNGRA